MVPHGATLSRQTSPLTVCKTSGLFSPPVTPCQQRPRLAHQETGSALCTLDSQGEPSSSEGRQEGAVYTQTQPGAACSGQSLWGGAALGWSL